MTKTLSVSNTAILLTLPFVGILALLLVEIARNAELIPGDALAIIASLSALPAVLLCTTEARGAYWIAFAMACLLALLHGLHIVEHVFAGDLIMILLIAVSMFLPSAFGAARLWTALRSDAAS